MTARPCIKRPREPDEYCSRCGERIGHQPALVCVCCRQSPIHAACLPAGETQHRCEFACEEQSPRVRPRRRTVRVELPREALGIAPTKLQGRRRAEKVELTTAQACHLNDFRFKRRRLGRALLRWLRLARLRRLACDFRAREAESEEIRALQSDPRWAGCAWLQTFLTAELQTRAWLAEVSAEAERAATAQRTRGARAQSECATSRPREVTVGLR